jgi:nitroreductase
LIVTVVAAVQPGKIPEIEQVLAVGAGVQNMLLAAHALGYGAMWKTGAPAYDAELKAELGFAATDQIVAFLYLGTQAGTLGPRDIDAQALARWG